MIPRAAACRDAGGKVANVNFAKRTHRCGMPVRERKCGNGAVFRYSGWMPPPIPSAVSRRSPGVFRAVCAAVFLTVSAHRGVCDAPAPAAPPGANLPVLTVPVRVHLMESKGTPAMHTTLAESDVRRIFGKANMIWSQAGVRFEIESIVHTEAAAVPAELEKKDEFVRVNSMIPKASLSTAALNVCYVKEVRPNGFFHSGLIVVKDTASLRPVEGGIDEPLPRVTSHEIGHALSLSHRQDMTNLMASGTTGFSLNGAEIKAAREKAKTFQTPKATDKP